MLNRVAPRVGAWIETLLIKILLLWTIKSHPVWVRGLKQSFSNLLLPPHVAPRVGAWIETKAATDINADVVGRTPCGCVD